MKKICLCFQIHQPYRLRPYKFFDIGNDHFYTDDIPNTEIFTRIAETCYLPANRMMLDLLRQYPEFRISYSISGLAIEQMENYDASIAESFRELAATGQVEFLAEPYAHSLTSLYDVQEWCAQVRMQQDKLTEWLGIKPSRTLCNTELIYSDDIEAEASRLGFEAVLTEGAKHILGWKSPNYLYSSPSSHPVTLIMRNSGLSEMISRDFSRYDAPEYPITADKILSRVMWLPEGEEFTTLFMNYEVLGNIHRPESGIFDFFRALPMMAERYDIGFATPSELLAAHSPVGTISVPSPISSSGEEKGVHQWVGNILQQGALSKLEEWGSRVRALDKKNRGSARQRLLEDWLRLQSADHFYYMNTGDEGKGFSPYGSAYEAFNNYMNVLSDFLLRVEGEAPKDIDTEELNSYERTITEQAKQIRELKAEVERLQTAKPTPRAKNKTKSLSEGTATESKPRKPRSKAKSSEAGSK